MKSIYLFCSLFLLYTGIFAQEGFKLGIHASLPVGENNDLVGLVAGIDTGYMFALGEVIDMGVATGFINGFPEKFHTETVLRDLPHVQFIPLAGSFRIWLSNSFSFGGDGGMAIGINEGNDGGLYYKPVIGYLLGAQTEVSISYTGIEVDGGEWTTVNLGFLYTFPTSRFTR